MRNLIYQKFVFLALRLEVDLQKRLEEKGVHIPWQDLMQDLKQV